MRARTGPTYASRSQHTQRLRTQGHIEEHLFRVHIPLMKIIHGPGRHLPPDLLTNKEEPEEMLENPLGQLGVLVETQVHPVLTLRQ